MSPSASPDAPALSPLQEQVALALAQGISVTAAAEAAGIHRSTIHNWLNSEKQFAESVRQARAEYLLALRDELQDLSRVALAAVRRLLEDPKTPAGVRAKLALAVLQRPQFGQPRAWNLPNPPAELPQPTAGPPPPLRRNSTDFDANSPTPGPPVRQNSTNSTKCGANPPSPHKVGRNDPCPCGSGQKFKRCCMHKLTAAA